MSSICSVTSARETIVEILFLSQRTRVIAENASQPPLKKVSADRRFYERHGDWNEKNSLIPTETHRLDTPVSVHSASAVEKMVETQKKASFSGASAASVTSACVYRRIHRQAVVNPKATLFPYNSMFNTS